MASATATATLAASGFDKVGNVGISASSTLQTPGSGTFPSELRSPMAYSPGFVKREESLKTPITPPSAYLDFLKNMSPAMMSPLSTGTSTRFHFNERPSFDKTSSDSIISPPTSQPNLSRNTSYDSNVSANSTLTSSSDQSSVSTSAVTALRTKRPESPRITIPPSQFVKPGPRSSRTPRRLHIPQSPFSPALGTANSAHSSFSSTPLSAAPWSASFSPRDADPEVNGKPGKVSVRHVVTRTVTYCRTPLEPAPRGKRRKLDDQTAAPSKSDDTPSENKTPTDKAAEPIVVKQEKEESDNATNPPTES